MKRTPNPQSVKNAALRLLARRDHGWQELKQKLLKKKYPANEIDPVLEQLQDQGWLSDQRFVKSFIGFKLTQGYGPIKVQYELQTRGIPTNFIQMFLWDDEFDWFNALKELCNKKFNGQFAKQATERAKQFQFLQRRGFTLDQIKKLMKFECEDYKNRENYENQ